jgi:hypothetical protein
VAYPVANQIQLGTDEETKKLRHRLEESGNLWADYVYRLEFVCRF